MYLGMITSIWRLHDPALPGIPTVLVVLVHKNPHEPTTKNLMNDDVTV